MTTKAKQYVVALRCVLGRKEAVRDAELILRRDRAPEFKSSHPSGASTRSSIPFAAVGDGGGLLVVSGHELPADKVPDLITWLKETFIDDTEEAGPTGSEEAWPAAQAAQPAVQETPGAGGEEF